MTSLLPSVLPSSTRMISNGRVCEEGCRRMTESKLSMSGGRFSRSSFIGTMTEAHGRGASVMKSRPARYQRSKKSLRLHSIEGVEDGQSRRDTAVQKRNCKVACYTIAYLGFQQQ